MQQQATTQRTSWLSLVAETAGVSGATVARVEIRGESALGRAGSEWRHAILQVQDDSGAIVGAVAWEGEARELAQGVTVDVGCDLEGGFASRVIGWIQTSAPGSDPAHALPPWHAAACTFDPTRSMKLMLHQPTRRALAVRSIPPRVAA